MKVTHQSLADLIVDGYRAGIPVNKERQSVSQFVDTAI